MIISLGRLTGGGGIKLVGGINRKDPYQELIKNEAQIHQKSWYGCDKRLNAGVKGCCFVSSLHFAYLMIS